MQVGQHRYVRRASVLLIVAMAGCTAGIRSIAGVDGASVEGGMPGIDAAAGGRDSAVPGDLGFANERLPRSDCDDAPRSGIYVLEASGVLWRFDPDILVFTRIGLLNCPGVAAGSYHSMAVDRIGTAWINAVPTPGQGQLFRADIRTALCSSTTFQERDSSVLGMGFSADSPGSSAETLLVSIHAADPPSAKNGFGFIMFPSLKVTSLGANPAQLELTGTGDGELWGYRPSGVPLIGQIDKQSGAFLKFYPVPAPSSDTGEVAYAFAFWGDSFWLFFKCGPEPSTTVYRMRRATGAVSTALPAIGKIIVGAGVSTCAPTIIP